jgi:hypothetical protein
VPRPVMTAPQPHALSTPTARERAQRSLGRGSSRVVVAAAGPGSSVVVTEDGAILTFGSGLAAAVHGASGGYTHIATPMPVATSCAEAEGREEAAAAGEGGSVGTSSEGGGAEGREHGHEDAATATASTAITARVPKALQLERRGSGR